jgi:CheY-like chemotaxis protein
MASDGRSSRVPTTVLIVDDEPDVRLLLTLILHAAGFEVETAADGFEALLLLEVTRPDLVLLDLMMPRMDGWELIEAIRVNARTYELPIVVMSAKFGLINTRGHDVQGYIRKPIVPLDMLDTLDYVLRQGTVSTDR